MKKIRVSTLSQGGINDRGKYENSGLSLGGKSSGLLDFLSWGDSSFHNLIPCYCGRGKLRREIKLGEL